MVLNNIGDAIHDSIVNNIENTISEQIHDSIVNNIVNNISEQIHDSIVDALGDYQIQNCDDVNDCVATAIADGNSDINHAIDTVVLNNIGDAIHDSIVNNISEQIHDSIANNVTTTNICATIESECDNVPLKNGDNVFTGTNTVPRGFDINTTDESNCNNVVVNACDLLAVFDSLCRRIEKLENAIPPVANAPTVSNVTSTSMNVKANATSQGAAITSYEFCISTNSDMSGATCQTVLASDADNVTFTGLDPNTNYYVQYSATNFAGTTTSPTVQERTLAHAPTADVTPPAPIKPAGFDVHVDDVDPKEKDEATVQVCYVLKGSGDCPEKESPSYSACTDPVTVTDGGSAIISQTGLEASTEYCVIVKVSNEDSTTIYGPFTVTTGADVTMTISGPSDTNRCGAETIALSFMATITGDNANDFTYVWSAGTSTNNKDTVNLSANSTITVTATHTTEGYTLTATKTTTVGNNPVSIGFCESEGVVSVKSVSGSPNSIDWGDTQTGTSVTTSTTHDYAALGNGSHEVTITASNASGCILSRTMTVNVLGSGSTVADRTVKPCDVGSHAAQTGSTYSGNGFGSANHGLETVNGSGQITSVTDYDGNEYPVVQIGSQCWMAENLRVSHSPKTGSNIVVTAVNNYGSKMAAWYNNDQSTYAVKRYGLLYNWCAAMDTANPSGYVEVATAANTSNQFSFTPSGNHQGVCPVGWHVPTDAEWNAMELEVNGSDVSGSTGYRGSHAGKLSTGCDWSSSSTENAAGNYANAERNSSGFSAVPAGNFYSSFANAGYRAYFWSSSQSSSYNAWNRYLDSNSAGVYRSSGSKYYGFSVRCVRDTVAPAVRPVLSVSAASGTVNLCGETTVDVPFTATITGDDASDYTFAWSDGASTTSTNTVALAAGTHTITVTATSSSHTLTASTSVTVSAGGTAATLKLCEEPSMGKVLVDNTNCTSLSWKNSSNVEVSTSLTELAVGGGITAGAYTVTGVTDEGCSITKQVVLGNYNPRPCTSSSMGSHTAQSTGFGNAFDGLETVESGNIISVKDYDGNEYPVVEIGSQCWMAVNLRTTHYANGSSVPAGTTSNSSTTAPYYYDYSSSSIPLEQRGYLYNWPATMKSTTTAGTQGVCPTGWHVPTRTDWQTMVAAAETGAVYLSSSCYWSGSTSGTEGMTPNSYDNPDRNKSGFSAVPAGIFGGSAFSNAGDNAYFWSSSVNSSGSWYRNLPFDYPLVYENGTNRYRGLSIRCLRDLTPAATLSVTSDAGSSVRLCGQSTRDVPFTATITGDDASNYTFAWSSGTSTTGKDTATLANGTHNITVTATHNSLSYTLTASTSVTVSTGGTAVSIGLCENEGIVNVRSVSGTPNHIDWGDGESFDGTINTSTSHEYASLSSGNHLVTITATNNDGCPYTFPMIVSGGTAADRTVKPCNAGSHAAQTGSAYMGNGYNGANHGFETVNGSGQITSVTDYDGNAYPVVQIGSQCWLAENLRCSHSPKTGHYIVGTAVQSKGSKLAAWYDDDPTYEGKRYGLLYSWCAVMDTANPGSGAGGSGTYVEVADGSNNNNNPFNFLTPDGVNNQGICPTGWHVAREEEWTDMECVVNEGCDNSWSPNNPGDTPRGEHAAKLTSTSCLWNESTTNNAAVNYANTERNESGFSALPASFYRAGFHNSIGSYTRFWTGSQRSGTSSPGQNYKYGFYRTWGNNSTGVTRLADGKDMLLSVRCVRDN